MSATRPLVEPSMIHYCFSVIVLAAPEQMPFQKRLPNEVQASSDVSISNPCASNLKLLPSLKSRNINPRALNPKPEAQNSSTDEVSAHPLDLCVAKQRPSDQRGRG